VTASQDPFGTPPEGAPSGSGSAPGSPYGSHPADQPGYGRPDGPAGSPKNGLGVAALVLGILAILTFWTVAGGVLLGLIAIVLGVVGRGRAKRGEATNGGMALAGVILGALGLLVSVALIALGASFLNSGSGKKLQDCIDSAGQDQAAVEQCQRDFAEDFSG